MFALPRRCSRRAGLAAAALALALPVSGPDAAPRPVQPGIDPGRSAPAETSRAMPSLLIPARRDSLPPESAPAPFITPGHFESSDSALVSSVAAARAQYRIGLSLERSSPGAAVVAYRNALRIDPEIRDAAYRAGLLMAGVGSYADAAKMFAAEVKQHPDHDDAERELGVALTRTGHHPEAIKRLESLSRRQPRVDKNWQALGFAYASAGRSKDAEAALRRSIELAPERSEEHRDLGAVIAAAGGRDREARTEYRRAAALAPDDPSVWINLGNLERRAGRPDSALADYRRAEACDSSLAMALAGQIEVLHESGRLAEAAEVYRRRLHRQPADHAARLEAIRLEGELGRPDRALELAREGIRDAVGEGTSWEIYGMTLAGQGRPREALDQLRRAESMYRDRPADAERVRALITRLRAGAPDSLRAVFAADSVAHATPPPAAPAPRK